MSVLVFRQNLLEIGCKDTTIFLSRSIFIVKLTPGTRKNLFHVAKKAKKMAKDATFGGFEWQNAEALGKLLTFSQITICHQAGRYSNT